VIDRPVTAVHVTDSFTPRPHARHVVFDFDGTLSLVRGGWAEVMLGMFLALSPSKPYLPPAEWRAALVDDIRRLNGHPTILQMQAFIDRVRLSGGDAGCPKALLADFAARLDRVIAERTARIAAGTLAADALAVPGALRMLTLLAARGLVLHLVSGTELVAVRREAELLGFARFFGERIHGPNGDDGFSKGAVIDRIVAAAGDGSAVVSFGDGPVEMRETRRVGGLAVAVASDETGTRRGLPDEAKHAFLLSAGAHAVVPDYLQAEAIVATVFGPGAPR
jgi:phosphoglycolate phosphatase